MIKKCREKKIVSPWKWGSNILRYKCWVDRNMVVWCSLGVSHDQQKIRYGEKENEREVAIWRKREICSNSRVVHCWWELGWKSHGRKQKQGNSSKVSRSANSPGEEGLPAAVDRRRKRKYLTRKKEKESSKLEGDSFEGSKSTLAELGFWVELRVLICYNPDIKKVLQTILTENTPPSHGCNFRLLQGMQPQTQKRREAENPCPKKINNNNTNRKVRSQTTIVQVRII